MLGNSQPKARELLRPELEWARLVSMRQVLMVILSMLAISARAASGDPTLELVTALEQADRLLEKVDSYTAIFHNQERIEGKMTSEQIMEVKFKKPFKVYLKWVDGSHKGREALYVQGENGNRLKVHAGGLLGLVTVNLDPQGARALKGSRHPITDVGLHKLVGLLLTNTIAGSTNGHLSVRHLGQAEFFGRKTIGFEGVFMKGATGYYCHRAILHLDSELMVPIKVQIFDEQNQVVEIYGYENLRLNADLTAADFDPANPNYKF